MKITQKTLWTVLGIATGLAVIAYIIYRMRKPAAPAMILASGSGAAPAAAVVSAASTSSPTNPIITTTPAPAPAAAGVSTAAPSVPAVTPASTPMISPASVASPTNPIVTAVASSSFGGPALVSFGGHSPWDPTLSSPTFMAMPAPGDIPAGQVEMQPSLSMSFEDPAEAERQRQLLLRQQSAITRQGGSMTLTNFIR